jgi:hypothetical protein
MRRGPKEIDKIVHHYEPRIDGKRHRVGIKMKSDNGEAPIFYTEHFKETKEDYSRPKVVKKEFAQLSELYDWIDDMLANQIELVWLPKIFVEVRGQATGHLDWDRLVSAEVEITAEVIEYAEHGDRRWQRRPDRPSTMEKFSVNIGYGTEQRYGWSNDPEEPYSRALIDDTPENREMLIAFSVKFDELRDQFFKAFAPEYIHRFLAEAAGVPLLSAPLREGADDV